MPTNAAALRRRLTTSNGDFYDTLQVEGDCRRNALMSHMPEDAAVMVGGRKAQNPLSWMPFSENDSDKVSRRLIYELQPAKKKKKLCGLWLTVS